MLLFQSAIRFCGLARPPRLQWNPSRRALLHFDLLRHTMGVCAPSFHCLISHRAPQILDCRCGFSVLEHRASVLNVELAVFVECLNSEEAWTRGPSRNPLAENGRNHVILLRAWSQGWAGKLRRVNPHTDKKVPNAVVQTSGLTVSTFPTSLSQPCRTTALLLSSVGSPPAPTSPTCTT